MGPTDRNLPVTKTKPRSMTCLMAGCRSAAEAAAIGRDVSPRLHEMCKGHCMSWELHNRVDPKDPKKTLSERRQVYKTCTCACHESNPLRCTVCDSSDYEMADARCVDSELCHERQQEQLDNNDLYQRIRASQKAGAIAKAEERERRREADPDTIPRRPRGETRPTVGRCEHCGEPTKGGKFVAGHDAKLKGELKRAAEAGEIEALAELMIRNWPTHTAKVSVELRQAATDIFDREGEGWLATRVAGRIDV